MDFERKEIENLKVVFDSFIEDYENKPENQTDKDWLYSKLVSELPEVPSENHKATVDKIMTSMEDFEANLESINNAASKGISKEKWFEEKVKESAVGMSVVEYGEYLDSINDFLHQTNINLEKSLTVSTDRIEKLDNRPLVDVDGTIRGVNMNPNLDGIIAEEIIAKSAQLDAKLKGKNVDVRVLQSHNKNSVDVRIKNLDTGEFHNYQLKFGKTAKETIKYIEDGNYNNQQIIVPSEQLEEVKKYFADNGSSKTITDHVEGFGVKGKEYSKEELKEIQRKLQENGDVVEIGYDQMHTDSLLKSIGKNAGAMALQASLITTGYEFVRSLFSGEKIDGHALAKKSLMAGSEVGIKTILTGAIEVAIQKKIISFITKDTSIEVISGFVCVGVENAKILYQIATKKISPVQGLDKMGKTTLAMVAGLFVSEKASAIGKEIGKKIGNKILPGLGGIIGEKAGGILCSLVGYSAGSETGELVYEGAKKVLKAGNTIVKSVVENASKAYTGIKNKVRNLKEKVMSEISRKVSLY